MILIQYLNNMNENKEPSFNLKYGHLGNGITVWYENTDITVAHISPDRTISYRQNVSEEIKKEVFRISRVPNITVSVTQEENVYTTKVYTESDVKKMTSDIDVLSLPKRIYCDTEETLRAICSKLSECHIGTVVNWEQLFIQA